MELLESHLDTESDEFKANAAHHRALAAELGGHLERTRQGGGGVQVARPGKAGGGPYYAMQYLREQSRTVISE